jgi:hypothetical protein
MDELEGALIVFVSRQGMGVAPTRQGGGLLVDLGVVLHRAGAQGIELRVYREVLLREPREVPHEAELVQLGQAQARASEAGREGRSRHVAVGQAGALAPGRGKLEEERLFPQVHSAASSRDRARSSIWPLVHISVTQTRSSCVRSG